MGGKKSRREKSIRVSASDYVASLVRSPHYLADYDAFRKRDRYVRAEMARGIVLPEKPKEAFLNRWPLLLKPIPPEKARLGPGKFVGHIVPSVVRSGDAPESWASGNLWDWPVIAQLPWPQARFLPFFINLGRPDDEIIADLKKVLRLYRLPGARESVQRAREMPDRWMVWDTFQGLGKKDGRKTTEILFPNSFKYSKDRKEMKEEAEREYRAKIGRGEKKQKAMFWLDNRVGKAKTANWRVRERKKLIAYVLQAIDVCKRMVEMHVPRRQDPELFRII